MDTAQFASNASFDPALDVEELDQALDAAIRAGEAGDLRVLGYGEITLVLGWPTSNPHLAIKRLPLFAGRPALDRYSELVERYRRELAERNVPSVPTVVRSRETRAGLHAYLVQPLVPRRELLNNVLRGVDAERGVEAERGADLLAELVQRVAAAVDERVGLDAQAANWWVGGGSLLLFDLSTPMLRTAQGRHELDVSVFVSIYPRPLRRLLRPVAHSIMAQFHDPRTVLLDVASNLVKEGLERWLPALLAAANAVVDPPLDEAEVRRYFTRDRRLWLAMQRLRRVDRAWQRRVRRRPYPFLLPPPYAYGPQELPEESDR